MVVRLIKKDNNDCVPLQMIAAGHHLMAGTFTYAAGRYVRAYRMMPNDPLLTLCCGVAYLRMVTQRTCACKHLVAVHAFAFFQKYFRMCGGESSSLACYNVGRAYHQLNLCHLAVPYYEKALAATDDTNAYENLKRESAFNLSLIYRKSGSGDLARHILRTHI